MNHLCRALFIAVMLTWIACSDDSPRLSDSGSGDAAPAHDGPATDGHATGKEVGPTPDGPAAGDGQVQPDAKHSPDSGQQGSVGCGKSGAFSGVNETATIKAMGLVRSYVLSVPSAYDPKTPHPIIFGFHGLNATGKSARSYLKLEKATGPAAIFVYPTAQNIKSGWKMKVGGGDIELFDALLASLAKSHCVDLSRVYSTGFSHGAMFTNNLTCVRLGKLRGIAPTGGSGPWYSTCKGQGSLPAMVIHGTSDSTVKFTDGVKTRDHWRIENGCASTTKAVTPSPCVAYDGCKQPVIFCAFTGGHTVPTFAGQGVRDFFMSLK